MIITLIDGDMNIPASAYEPPEIVLRLLFFCRMSPFQAKSENSSDTGREALAQFCRFMTFGAFSLLDADPTRTTQSLWGVFPGNSGNVFQLLRIYDKGQTQKKLPLRLGSRLNLSSSF